MICNYCHKEIPDESIFCLFCGRKQQRSAGKRRRGNGEGYIAKRGNTYTAVHTAYRRGKRYTRTKGGFKTQKEAKEWLANNTVFDIGSDRQTLAETYEEWSKMHYEKISKKKAQAYKAAWRCCDGIAPLYWDEVTLAMMQSATDKALNTYNQRKAVKIVLHSIEAYAIKNGVTDKRLAEYIELPEAVAPNKKPFTDAEVCKLKTAYDMGDEVAGALLIMIYTGMRFGEFSTIDPKNIHLSDGYLMGGIKTEAGKTGEILILPEVAPIIEKLMLPVNKFAISSTAFSKRMKVTLEKAGCDQHTAHECRHTTATFLARAGVQPGIISSIMRHTNYQQTLAYTHVDRQTKLDALSKSITYK